MFEVMNVVKCEVIYLELQNYFQPGSELVIKYINIKTKVRNKGTKIQDTLNAPER